jgi:hypothetical protein
VTIETIDQPGPLVPIEPAIGQVDLTEWVKRAAAAQELMAGLVDSFFVPAAYKPGGNNSREVAIANGTGAILLGQSLGVDPLTALQNIYIINGRPGMYAKFKVALAQAKGHEIWTEVQSDTVVTVSGRRRGSERVESITITIEQAKTAGWFTNKNYEKTPGDMLWARCASRVADRVAGNDLFGIPSIEDLEDGPDDRVRTVTNVTASDIQARTAVPAAPAIGAAGTTSNGTVGVTVVNPPATAEQPPASVPVGETGEASTLEQRQALGVALRALDLGGTDDKVAALKVISAIAERVVTATSDLARSEADRVLAKLGELSKRTKPKWQAEIRQLVADAEAIASSEGADRG